MTKNISGRGQRELREKVKTARGRKLSSTLWLERQLNDPYVKQAKAEGYRGRAAFKIVEIDDKFRFLVPGARVVDLGCAPGGWCQVAVRRTNALAEKPGKKVGRVIGVDLQHVDPIPGVELHQLDFLDDDADALVKGWLGGRADVVLSDMAAAASGNQQVDHLRIVILCEAAAMFAFDVLKEGGAFVAKVLAGGAEASLQLLLKKNFTKVVNIKPPASRADSSEKFVVATGFKGNTVGVDRAQVGKAEVGQAEVGQARNDATVSGLAPVPDSAENSAPNTALTRDNDTGPDPVATAGRGNSDA